MGRMVRRLSIIALLVAALSAASSVPAFADLYGVMTTICERAADC